MCEQSIILSIDNLVFLFYSRNCIKVDIEIYLKYLKNLDVSNKINQFFIYIVIEMKIIKIFYGL